MKRRLCRHEALACARMKRSAPLLFRVPKARFIERSSASFFMHRKCASFRKVPFVGRQKRLFCWSRVRESNPPSQLGKLLYYRYTNPACRFIISKPNRKFKGDFHVRFCHFGVYVITCLPISLHLSITNFVPREAPSQNASTRSAYSMICIFRCSGAARPNNS